MSCGLFRTFAYGSFRSWTFSPLPQSFRTKIRTISAILPRPAANKRSAVEPPKKRLLCTPRCLAGNPEPFHRRLLSHGCSIRSFASCLEKSSLAPQSFRARRQTSVSAVEPPDPKKVLCTPRKNPNYISDTAAPGFVRICTDLYGFVRRVMWSNPGFFSPYRSVPIRTHPYFNK